jgi:hypothetical protein
MVKQSPIYCDSATGLQNNLNRWCDASVGRWLSEDPISCAPGDASDTSLSNDTDIVGILRPMASRARAMFSTARPGEFRGQDEPFKMRFLGPAISSYARQSVETWIGSTSTVWRR